MDKYSKNSLPISLPLIFIILFSHLAHADSFQVYVPDRGAVTGLQPLRDIDLFVDLPIATTGIVDFRVTRGMAGDQDYMNFSVNSVVGASDSVVTNQYADDEIPPERFDQVTISAHHVPGTVVTKRFKIHMQLETNWNTDSTGVCVNRQTGDETWTIETISYPPISFKGTCINSYALSPGSASCDALPVPTTVTPATIISSSDIPTVTPCADKRPPVDIVLVLDKSGSMNRPVTGQGKNKIDALNDAFKDFVDVWNQSGIATLDDKFGTVLFNSDANDWLVDLGLTSGLNSFSTDLKETIIAPTSTITAGGLTSIGDGLELAADYLDPGTTTNLRKIILLMSDGKQNSDRMVAVIHDTSDLDGDLDITEKVVVTHSPNGTDYSLLPGHDNVNIWSVSFGVHGTDVDATIFNALADTGTGFYLNSQLDADELRLFFLELLQNFLRFNTIETTRITSDTIPITHIEGGDVGVTHHVTDIGTTQLKVATTSTAKTISFSVMWDKSKNPQFSMTITPPAGPPITSKDGSGRIQGGDDGFMRFTTHLPLDEPYPLGSQIGDWVVDINVQGNGLGDQFPYQFYALADDDIVKAKFDIDNRDYVTGNPIPLQVQLTEFRKPLTGKDGALKVFATLIKPEDGIGNLLAENSATITAPPGDEVDTGTPTQQELDALLEENPDFLKYSNEVIPLFDDGLSSHGDAVANDGIFNNLYEDTDKQGHYNFLFTVDGPTHGSGPINRQQIETVYVRLKPDAVETEISSETIGDGPDQQLKVIMTPRDRFGNYFGPGYANHFLVSPINGKQPKFTDKNLDGVYELTIPASAAADDPVLDVRYVKPFINVSDEMYPNHIPQGLAETFIEDGLSVKKSSVSFHLGSSFPHGNLSNDFDGDIAYAIDYEYRWRKSDSLLLFMGQNQFDHPIIDLDITNISVNAKHYFNLPASGNLRYFINGGVGYYLADPGDNDAGLNIGGGVQYPINNSYGVEAWYNYHLISSSPTIKFSTLQFGAYYRF